MLVVYRGDPRTDAYAIVRETLGIRGLEPHCYSVTEAEALAPVLAQMAAGGIEVGIEKLLP